MQATITPNEDLTFFHKHAGFSFDPLTETLEQGRMRGAAALVEAESLYLQAHRVADVGCEWRDDPEAESDTEFEDTCEGCIIWHLPADSDQRAHLASLWGITDASPEYRRVIRAELALECADALRAIIAKG